MAASPRVDATRGRGATRRRLLALVLGAAAVALIAALAVAARVAGRVTATLTPPRQPVAAPRGLGAVRDVALTTRDGIVLRGWYVPSTNRAAVILGHGHGAQRGQLLPEARALVRAGYGVLMFDWRAHGESGGRRTTWGVDEPRDLQAALDFVLARPDVDARRVGALGFSMGAMIIAGVAERDPRIRAVVIAGAAPSLAEEASFDERHWGWWSERVAVWTLRLSGLAVDAVRPIDSLCRLSPRPVLVVGGSADTNVPRTSAPRMFQAACDPKQLYIIPGATHMTYEVRGGAEFERQVVRFFGDALLRDAARPRAPDTAPLARQTTGRAR
jgi:alpha-beta hydrolase superfamily lysophospholipase